VQPKRLVLISIIVLILLSAFFGHARATGGMPNSPLFGYGARLDMWGQDINTAMDLAAGLGLDWIAIDMDWSRHWPSIDQSPDFSALDSVLLDARLHNLPVLLSFTHAPAWALTPSGPEPGITSTLLQSILNAYPDVILAVELFPGANSINRWGANPNPQAYLTLLQTTRQVLDSSGRSAYLVTSLEPLMPGTVDGSLDDLVFLDSLYALGGLPYLPILGIRFQTIFGDPMAGQDALNPIVLRHYEQVRDVMLAYQHNSGILWITGFAWPTSGPPDPADPLNLPTTPELQAQWFNQAYQQLQAQLYIGTAFFSNLNQLNITQPSPALLQSGSILHPANVHLSQLAEGSISSTAWTPSTTAAPLSPVTDIPTTAQTPPVKFLRVLDKLIK